MSKGMPHVGLADSVTNNKHGSRSDISDWSSSNPVTRVIKVTLLTPAISLYNHSYIHTRIHSICPCPPDDSSPESLGGSGTKPSHVQRNASQCSMLRHEVVVASFKHEQRPTGDSKAGPRRARGRPTSNKARGENVDEPRVALTQSAPKQTWSSQHSRSILNLSASQQNLH